MINNNPIEDIIEDIIIDNNYSNKKKGKGKPIIIAFFVLLILLVLIIGAYFYLKNKNKKTNKELFFDSISNSNLEFFTNNELYSQIINKYSTNDSTTDTNLSFSTTMKQPDEVSDIDFSKFNLNLNTINSISNSEMYNELKILYSDNELLKVKCIKTENQVGIISDEIVNKYIGISKESLNQMFQNYKYTLETYNSSMLSQTKVEVSDSTINIEDIKTANKFLEYKDILLNNFIEEEFTTQNNYVLQKENSGNVNVTSYELNVSQEKLNTILKEMLNKLKTDDDFIKKIVTEESALNANSEDEGTNETNTTTDVNQQTDETNEELNVNNFTNLEPVGTSVQDIDLDKLNNAKADLNLESDEQSSYEENETSSNFINFNEIFEEEIKNAENIIFMQNAVINLSLGKKISCTSQELKDFIDECISDIDEQTDGEGLKITVYVSEKNTEKITIVLPNSASFDIEFNETSENEKKVILTYLLEEDAIKYNEDNAVIYSASDNTMSEVVPNVTEKQTNGFKLEFYKLKNDASTKINAIYSFIENKEINKKLSLNLVTDGSTTSKNFENELILTYSTNDGEIKLSADNKIKFGTVELPETLNEENTLFIDTLEEQELNQTLDAITQKIQTVYTEKRKNLNFIDTNNQTAIIKQNANATRDGSRDILISTISTDMGKTQEKGEEYTINNLENLKIENHEVTVTIENDIANVNVDGFKFTIDSNFNLSDVD